MKIKGATIAKIKGRIVIQTNGIVRRKRFGDKFSPDQKRAHYEGLRQGYDAAIGAAERSALVDVFPAVIGALAHGRSVENEVFLRAQAGPEFSGMVERFWDWVRQGYKIKKGQRALYMRRPNTKRGGAAWRAVFDATQTDQPAAWRDAGGHVAPDALAVLHVYRLALAERELQVRADLDGPGTCRAVADALAGPAERDGRALEFLAVALWCRAGGSLEAWPYTGPVWTAPAGALPAVFEVLVKAVGIVEALPGMSPIWSGLRATWQDVAEVQGDGLAGGLMQEVENIYREIAQVQG
jgi:hypothetical protein